MIKKISLFMLSACISVALFGCSGKDKAENNSETASKQVVIENFGVVVIKKKVRHLKKWFHLVMMQHRL